MLEQLIDAEASHCYKHFEKNAAKRPDVGRGVSWVPVCNLRDTISGSYGCLSSYNSQPASDQSQLIPMSVRSAVGTLVDEHIPGLYVLLPELNS
jgi:hypothetical protein